MKKFMRSTLLVVTFLLASMSASAGPVVEFYNVNLDHYFITSDANEAQAIDGGSAGPGWVRTSNSFNSGGTSAVCRFYGSQNPGPNSHFYTVDGAECLGLKQLQASTPATQKRWNFESLDFSSTLPTNGTCPTSTTPVYRAYNNGFARGVDSNHRISSNQAAIQEVVNRGWIYEGVVMCAPASGITAPTAVTIGYSQGDLSLTDPGLQKMTASLATTSGALLQAIYAVNSFVFTDPKVTDYATYVQRQADANQALDILILYAGQTEQNADALPTSAPSTLALLSPQGAPTSFKAAASPEEVLAVLNSSKSKWPIKTLMQQYQVSAKKAQLILNNAMNGLTSQAYLDEAMVDTQGITRLTLVKEASGLAVTVGSTFITAGAAGGVLTVFEAGSAIIGSTDAVIKVTKAGAELALGQDGALDEMFEKSTMVRGIADVNEIFSAKSLFAKSENLLDTTNKLIYVTGKLSEVFQEKKVSFGAESMTLTPFNDDFKAAYMARAKALQCPSTFPGNYVDEANQPVTVNAAAMPKAVLDALNALPVDAQLPIVQQILPDSPDVPGNGITLAAAKVSSDETSITYDVSANIQGITAPTSVVLSVANAAVVNASRTLAADGVLTWSVTVLGQNGTATVTRGDSGASLSITLPGVPIIGNNLTALQKMKKFDGFFSGGYKVKEGTEPVLFDVYMPWSWDTSAQKMNIIWNGVSFSGTLTVPGSGGGTVTNTVSGTVSDDGKALSFVFNSRWDTSNTIGGKVNTGEWTHTLQIENIPFENDISGNYSQFHIFKYGSALTPYLVKYEEHSIGYTNGKLIFEKTYFLDNISWNGTGTGPRGEPSLGIYFNH